MKSLLRLVIFFCSILCFTVALDELSAKYRAFPRSHARRPPPPFDLQTPPWRFPWLHRRVSTTASPQGTSKSTYQPIVLYKRDCEPCLPGWGVKSLCNDTSNTICQPCPMGTYSPHQPHYHQCTPCSKCGPNTFEQVSCVSYRDTKCDACSNPKATINDDYMKKCNWRQAARTVNPRYLDLDDTRFDVEVIDLQSKELSQLDGSPEFGSNEEDLDRMLLLPSLQQHEEDITVDDPEIDLEQPQPKKVAKDDEDDDVSKEEEIEWARVIAMRQKTSDEIAEISRRLEGAEREARQRDETDADDDDDDIEQGPRRLLLHPIRPLPQMVPVPKPSDFGEIEDDIVRITDPPENNFPPSYHSYPIDALVHAGQGQRRKAIVLLVLTCAIVLSTIIFVVCYVREYCRRRGAMYNRVLVVNLSPEEREIVRQSANVLERMEQPPKKHYGNGRSYTAVVDEEEDPQSALSVTENPLEAYLNATDERHVAKESLIENEVLDEDPKVHRRTADA